MRDIDVHLNIEPDDEGGYVTTSPQVPGLVLSTQSVGEAVDLAPGVIRDMIDVWREHGDPMPPALAESATPSRGVEVRLPIGIE